MMICLVSGEYYGGGHFDTGQFSSPDPFDSVIRHAACVFMCVSHCDASGAHCDVEKRRTEKRRDRERDREDGDQNREKKKK